MTDNRFNQQRKFKIPIVVYFLIDRQGRIYHYPDLDFSPSECFNHENIIEYHNLNEKDVCKLIYNPDTKYSYYNFVGIPEIRASCNLKYDALPFKLKKSHLDRIEKFFFSKKSPLFKYKIVQNILALSEMKTKEKERLKTMENKETTKHIQDVVINSDYKISVFQEGEEIIVSLKQIDIDETIEGCTFELPSEKFGH